MSEYFVCWRAHIVETGPGAEGRLARVIEELDAYQKVISPTYEIDRSKVVFGFGVEGFHDADMTAEWAERALRLSLLHARIASPADPDAGWPGLRLELEPQPTIRLMLR